MDRDQWQRISRDLKAPFAPDEVEWRQQGKSNSQGKTQVLAYIDARAVQDRLDAVVGCENWSFKWEPVAVVNGELKVAKGILTIFGVPKEDIGDAGNFEASKSAVSDSLKRVAVQWGIGRYLYELPQVWITLENGRIPEATLKQLQSRLAQRAQEKKAS